MDISSQILQYALTIAVLVILFVVQLPLRCRTHPVLRTMILIVKLVLIPAAAILFVAIVSPFTYRCGNVIAAVYTALIADAAADITELVVRRIRCAVNKGADRQVCLWRLSGVLSLVFCFCVAIYGTYNAEHVTVKTHTWPAEGLTQRHTFAFIADIHAGSGQSMETLQDLCRQINGAAPEFVILGGDITDELTSYDDMRTTYGILSQIEAPVFFVYGNHDRQPDSGFVGGRTYQDDQLVAVIREAGIRILSDEYVKAADDLILLGREDISAGDLRLPWAQLLNPYEGEGALVVADHQPYDEEQLAAEVSALQLSGHTHAGQLWPLQFVYRLLGLPAYGEFQEPGTRLYVSAGESGWMLPLRTEAHCEWELITLVPQTE